MSRSFWLWLATGLLLTNIALLLIHVLSEPAVRIDPQAVPRLDPDLPRLELVSELTNSEQTVDGEVCYSIGPLPSLLAQQRAEDRLRPFATAIRTRMTQADSDRGWWVYLPAASRVEAMDLTRQLGERGVEDFYVVTSGELENAVSVGLFESVDNARSRQARVRALGFNAQLEVRRETVPQFWIDYRIDPDERSPWRFIVRGSPGSQQRDIPCWDE